MATAVIADENKAQGQKTAPAQLDTRRDIKPLTTLRFIAAIVVILYHGNDSFTCWRPWAGQLLAAPSVAFFFVLSGFILTYIYGKGLPTGQSKVKFYLARVARIWPAHVCTLLLLVFLIPEVFKVCTGDWPLFFSNLFLVHAISPVWRNFFSYNASAWSVSTEIFFYFCFPLFLLLLNKKWYLPLTLTGSVLLGVIMFCNNMHYPEFDPTHVSSQGLVYIHPLSRAFDFTLGMTLSVFWRERWANANLGKVWATLLELSAIAAVIYVNCNSVAWRYALEPFITPAGAYWLQNCGPGLLTFVFLVGVFALEKGLVSKFLSQPLLVLLGELSFGIYLLHGILLTYLGVNFPQQTSALACTVFIIILTVSAHLMWEIVEKPMRSLILSFSKPAAERKKIKLSARHCLAIGLECAVFAGFIYLVMPTIHKISDSEAAQVSASAAVKNLQLPPYLKCDSANASVFNDAVDLTMVFEALKNEPINFSIKAIVHDYGSKAIGMLAYTQDGRVQQVKQGEKWLDKQQIAVTPGSRPASIAISVVRNKRNTLHTPGTHPADYSFVVPVTGRTF